MIFNIITIFPEIFNSYFNESIIKRAQNLGIIKINIINLRDFAADKHKTVDDTPYGGGAGMVMKVDILCRALMPLGLKNEKSDKTKSLKDNSKAQIGGRGIEKKSKSAKHKSKIILLSAKGEKWNQSLAKEFAGLDEITLLCGRYEGVDERIVQFIDKEISIGDYVLTGGEIGAMALLDSITRLLPGALGNETSAQDESHSTPGELEYPQYTRPEIFVDSKGKEHKVPSVLLSGNHAEIKKWREQMKRKLGN